MCFIEIFDCKLMIKRWSVVQAMRAIKQPGIGMGREMSARKGLRIYIFLKTFVLPTPKGLWAPYKESKYCVNKINNPN